MPFFQQPLPVGTAAPPFELPDENGDVFVLDRNRSRNVVLVFYPGDDTAICTSQLCDLRDNWDRVKARNAIVIGINQADAASHGSFKKKHQYPFPLLVDRGRRVAKLYHSGSFITRRTVYAIGPDGTILFAQRGKPSVDEILAAIPQ